MSHPIIKTTCVVAGFAVAALAATSALAGPPLTIEQKIEMGKAMSRNQQKAPPKTAATAEATERTDGAATVIEVPEDVYNFLSASADAQGNMVVRDVDANGHSPAVAVEVSDEK